MHKAVATECPKTFMGLYYRKHVRETECDHYSGRRGNSQGFLISIGPELWGEVTLLGIPQSTLHQYAGFGSLIEAIWSIDDLSVVWTNLESCQPLDQLGILSTLAVIGGEIKGEASIASPGGEPAPDIGSGERRDLSLGLIVVAPLYHKISVGRDVEAMPVSTLSGVNLAVTHSPSPFFHLVVLVEGTLGHADWETSVIGGQGFCSSPACWGVLLCKVHAHCRSRQAGSIPCLRWNDR